MTKYRYIGTGEIHLPSLGITVSQTGEVVETDQVIDNANFVTVSDQSDAKPELDVQDNKKKGK